MMNKIEWMRFYLLTILVGLIAGAGAIFFRDLIGFFHNLFFYGTFSTSYDVLKHALPSVWGPGVVFVPVAGAILVAFLVKNYAPEARGHGVPEVMEAIYYKKGIIRPVVAIVKAIASSISIGTGGSVGREGPIIQIGAAFGSTLGQIFKITDWERITLIACGAGGGIAATFNTPFGGILFALEIMLVEFSIRTMMPVMIATATATAISYTVFGDQPFLPFDLSMISVLTLPTWSMFLFLSVAIGMAAALFITVIYMAEDIFDLVPGGYYVRHVLGMFLVGISLYLMMQFSGHYYLQGVGYATVMDVLSGLLLHPGFLMLLAGLKMLDTALTLGSGGSGGVFSPLLFIGATLGGGLSTFIPSEHPILLMQIGALAGMAGMIGAATGASLTAIIMTAELIQNFNIILPLMAIVVIADLARRAFIKSNVYTLKLFRRGDQVPEIFYKKV